MDGYRTGAYSRYMSAVAIAIRLLSSGEQIDPGPEKWALTTHPWQNAPPHLARPPKSGYVWVNITGNHSNEVHVRARRRHLQKQMLRYS